MSSVENYASDSGFWSTLPLRAWSGAVMTLVNRLRDSAHDTELHTWTAPMRLHAKDPNFSSLSTNNDFAIGQTCIALKDSSKWFHMDFNKHGEALGDTLRCGPYVELYWLAGMSLQLSLIHGEKHDT